MCCGLRSSSTAANLCYKNKARTPERPLFTPTFFISVRPSKGPLAYVWFWRFALGKCSRSHVLTRQSQYVVDIPLLQTATVLGAQRTPYPKRSGARLST